jgi:SAM-dependent methyltransferase
VFAVLRCSACGLASTQPRIGPEQFAEYYPTGYQREPRTGLVERARLGAIIRFGPYRALARRRPGRLLDVGCGNGELARAFARRGWQVAGVEPGSEAAALLRAGGVVAVGVPNFGCWQRRVFRGRWFQLDLPRHLQHLDAHTLGALLVRAGLRPVDRTSVSMRPSLLVSLQYALFGRARWMGRGLRLGAWALAPLLLVLDRFVAGDCLHMLAVKEA